jgi:hypothetical protein
MEDFPTQFEDLERRTAAGLAQVKAASTETRQQLGQRIDQAQVDRDLAEKEVPQKAGEAPDNRQTKWAQMKADANAKREHVKAKIAKRNDQIDADMAATDANIAEDDAVDAINDAEWAVDNARLAVLDALDARAYAGERASAAAHH